MFLRRVGDSHWLGTASALNLLGVLVLYAAGSIAYMAATASAVGVAFAEAAGRPRLPATSRATKARTTPLHVPWAPWALLSCHCHHYVGGMLGFHRKGCGSSADMVKTRGSAVPNGPECLRTAHTFPTLAYPQHLQYCPTALLLRTSPCVPSVPSPSCCTRFATCRGTSLSAYPAWGAGHD